ncbi:MAG: FecR domain-containing protein, partial [Elainellaceae cyanobacterium]
MIRKLSLTLALSFTVGLLSPTAAEAVPLTRAVIRLLRNEVNLIPAGQRRRPASVSDTLTPGDALSTARQSFAEVQFNDGSLARLGESALFRFSPDTRTVNLNRGTVLMLITPGQGGTRIRTPNATAGIRGSALFVRYISEEEGADQVTVIGALTNSGITVCSGGNVEVCGGDTEGDASQQVSLAAGEAAVFVGPDLLQIYQFDLETFYQTAPLAAGLIDEVPSTSDNGVNTLVLEEIRDGIESSEFPADVGGEIYVNPDFTNLRGGGDLSPAEISGGANEARDFVDEAADVGEAGFDIRTEDTGTEGPPGPSTPDPGGPSGPDPGGPSGPDPGGPSGPDPGGPSGPDPGGPDGP